MNRSDTYISKINNPDELAALSKFSNVATLQEWHTLSMIHDMETGGYGAKGPMTKPEHLVAFLGYESDFAKEQLEKLRLLRILAIHPDGCYRLTNAGYHAAEVDLLISQDAYDLAIEEKEQDT